MRMEEDERAHIRRLRALRRNHEYSMQFAEFRDQGSNTDMKHARQHIHFYNELVNSGYGQLLLLHLCNNHEQIQPVLQGLNQQMQLDREHWLKMFSLLREADGLEGIQLEELPEQVLKHLTEGEGKNGAIAPKPNQADPKQQADSANGAPALGVTIIEDEPRARRRRCGELILC
jgi:hypothetical protein